MEQECLGESKTSRRSLQAQFSPAGRPIGDASGDPVFTSLPESQNKLSHSLFAEVTLVTKSP